MPLFFPLVAILAWKEIIYLSLNFNYSLKSLNTSNGVTSSGCSSVAVGIGQCTVVDLHMTSMFRRNNWATAWSMTTMTMTATMNRPTTMYWATAMPWATAMSRTTSGRNMWLFIGRIRDGGGSLNLDGHGCHRSCCSSIALLLLKWVSRTVA